MRLSTLFVAALFGFLSGCDDAGKETGDTEDTGPGVNLDDVDGDGLGPDEDCDDEDASIGGPTAAWIDADGDGYGDVDNAVETCTPGAGNATNSDDCDDAAAGVNPGAAEVCNGVDDNCDAAIDEGASGGGTWYTDADLDGYGDPATGVEACDAPAGAVADGTDCDDAVASVNPGATEVCDALDVDEDCDGAADDADDAPTGQASWFLDADADGYGDDAVAVDACDMPAGYAAAPGDCDDADAAFNPAADESDCADPADYNCDGSTGYADDDGDGYVACEECDDASAAVNPGAVEVCNDVDDDCDGDIDATATDAGTWYADADGDTYGDPASATVTCDAPAGSVTDATDCDDAAAAVNPGAVEVCDGAVDEDCDGLVDDADDSAAGVGTWYTDVDGDGYGDPTTAIDTCTAPELGVADGTDCDDTRATVSPAALEVCDSLDLDEDCDGAVDDADASVSDAPTWYADADGDTFGADGSSLAACDQPAGYAALPGDCDDADVAYRPDADESDCTDPNDYNCDGSVGFADGDADGYAACEECDDAEASTFPGADEYCDGADNDCDGTVDEADALDAGTWYADTDVDGYGDAATGLAACDAPAGYGADATDCDDTVSLVNPGATEVCDAADVDEDCDALADDADASVTGQSLSYVDVDGDGFGDDTDPGVAACDLPAGSAAVADDCDDTLAAINPDATELCDADDVDEDCDGLADDADAGADGGTLWYVDLDGDGYGDAADAGLAACDLPAGYVADNTDCDDDDTAVNPGATEVCDAADVDEDCDGSADDADADVTGTSTFYADADADGYGNSVGMQACEAPAGSVADSSDCDDTMAAINPGAAEVCDAANTDEDCDGAADDADASATGQGTYYADEDGDGHGGTTAHTVCDADGSLVSTSDDCDDTEGSVYPGAPETCNGADDDCDGTVDEADATDATTWYADADLDGYGSAGTTETACAQPSGYVADATDCDDAAAAINPAATEVCDGADTDEDCDGAADDADTSAAGKGTYYADIDGDGFGDLAADTLSCDAPTGSVTDATDCNDAAAAVNPAATETCNGIDDDCDGTADEDDAADVATWYADADGDGYGNAGTTDVSCAQPAGYVADATDCDDARPAVNPGATEACDGGNTDEDCDGAADDLDTAATGKARWYTDADRDAYGDAADAGALYCDPAADLVTNNDDCDDARAPVNPAGAEVCNGFDDDCDGTTDGDDAADVTTWYADADGDTYGDPAATDMACYEPTGFVADMTDCDDTAATVNPMGTETCNSEDDDCDGSVDEDATDFVTWYADIDSDGYGAATLTDLSCEQPAGHVADATDCDDSASAVNPGATEACDAADTDEDCDGAADDADTVATGKGRWYTDADGDTYGTGAGALYCDPAADLVANDDDCDDAAAAVNPTGTETCNGIDDNCDGATDGDDAADVATWYADADGDTYGDPAATDMACYEPTGFVADMTDCDDTAASVNPMGTETCNSEDDDCDGSVDEDATDRISWNRDADGDTYGNPYVTVFDCTAPDGYLADAGDCDDTNADINPAGTEVCDDAGADEDCDTLVDDADPSATGASTWYADADGDGYGVSDTTTMSCDAPASYAAEAGDCDDGESTTNPGAAEVCDDGVDNDCVEDTECLFDGQSSAADADHTFLGTVASDGLGTAVAGADVNGDGIGDLAISAFGADRGSTLNAGGTWIFLGPIASTDTLATADATIQGNAAGDRLGFSIANLGDADADGFDALLMGADGQNVGAATDAGAAYIFDNAASGALLVASAVATITGVTTLDFTGTDVAGPGDVDGDGTEDAVIGAFGRDTSGAGAGAVGLFNGPVTGTMTFTDADVLINGFEAGDNLGWSVDAAGDIDGDGINEFIAGAYGADPGAMSLAGAAYIFNGLSISGSAETEYMTKITGSTAGDELGYAVTGAGDVNDDGYDDVLVGAHKYNVGAVSDAGAAYLFLGSASWIPSGDASGADAIFTGSVASDAVGRNLGAGGDVNQDGYADLLIAAGGWDSGALSVGAMFLVYGPVSGTVSMGSFGAEGDADATFYGVAASDGLGGIATTSTPSVKTLDIVPDLDADGYDEIVGGARSVDTGASNAGAAYLWYGGGI